MGVHRQANSERTGVSPCTGDQGVEVEVLEHMTDGEVWEELKRLKKRKAYAWHYAPLEVDQLDEMILEIENEITARQGK